MHQFQIGFMGDMWRRTGTAPAEKALRRVAEEGIILASTGAEANSVAGDWTTPTIARREGDGYLILRVQAFLLTGAGHERRSNSGARRGDRRYPHSWCRHASDGVSIVETGDTTGMRATASHDVVLDNVLVSVEAAVGGRLAEGAPMRKAPTNGVAVWFLPLMSSVYLGVAERGAGRGLQGARRRHQLELAGRCADKHADRADGGR